MRHNIEVVNPIEQPGWDERVTRADGWTFFHTVAWARVLWETYRYRPLYFTVRDDDALLALVAMMEVKSPFTGCRGVSLPFTDYCGPLISQGTRIEDVNEFIMEYGRKAGWKSIECRGDSFPGMAVETSFYRHELVLSPDVDRLFAGLKGTTRRNIRKAMREGVTVSIEQSLDAVKEYYRLHCMTRKKHGLPPQPYTFFEKIHEHIISRDFGVVVLASHQGVNVAGDVFFGLKDKALYKYGASDYAYQHLRPSDLVMWEGIKRYAQSGYRTLCFGRTAMDNDGLRRFKGQWGVDEQIINYYKYDLRRDVFVTEAPRVGDSHHRFFHALPIPVLKVCGALLYRHMG